MTQSTLRVSEAYLFNKDVMQLDSNCWFVIHKIFQSWKEYQQYKKSDNLTFTFMVLRAL